MSSIRIHQVLVYAFCILIAVFMGTLIVDGTWKLPLGILLIGGYLLLTKATRVTVETYILSFLVFGYIVGNRGFAQITPFGNLPLFMGEIGLLLGAGFVILHISLKKEFPFQLDALGISIIIWIIVGSVRVFFDYRNYGILALRDFAMVYYSGFYFIAQTMAKHAHSRKVFEVFFQVALFLLIPGFFLFKAYPEFFFHNLVFDGMPIIYYKGDLVGTFLGIGFIYYYCRYCKTRSIFTIIYAFTFFFLTIYLTVRAAYVGLAFAFLLLFLTKKNRILTHFSVASLILIPLLTVYYGIFAESFQQTQPYTIYEHIVSLTDFSGARTYKTEGSIGTGGNNQFRIIWWKTVFDQTLRNSPFFGLGFGYDLTGQFFLRYYNLFEDRLGTRSPHSIIVTIFGRMGIIGMILFLMILIFMTKRTSVAIPRARELGTLTEEISYWCMAWLILVSSFFGVVLEGPMGAIIFWIILGIANTLSVNESNRLEKEENQFLQVQIRIQEP